MPSFSLSSSMPARTVPPFLPMTRNFLPMRDVASSQSSGMCLRGIFAGSLTRLSLWPR